MKTFTFSEFKSYLNQRPMIELQKNKEIEKCIVFAIATILFITSSTVAQAAGIDTSRLDEKGRAITNMMLKIGRWSVIIMAVWEGSKAIMGGNAKGVPQIILKYVLAYASLMALPWLMSEVDGLFK